MQRRDAACKVAVYSTTTSVLEALLLAGANVDSADSEGETALWGAVRCNERALAVLMAAGANVNKRNVRDELPSGRAPTENVLAMLSECDTQAVKKQVELAGLNAIRWRAFAMCVGLQPLGLSALETIEILTRACAPFAGRLPFHYLWDIVTCVKHFRDRTVAHKPS